MFSAQLQAYRRRFSHCRFRLHRRQNLANAIREANVPRQPGAYVITSGSTGRGRVLYIGMAGKIKTKGQLKGQTLRTRLNTLQRWQGERVRRNIFFQDRMRALHLRALTFEWFITFDESTHIIPAAAEAILLQSYFDQYGRLPAWNHEF